MKNRTSLWLSVLSLSFIPFIAHVASAEETGHMTARNMAAMKFERFPGMPTCSTGSVENGDPSKDASIILAKLDAGCVFPLHWHTPAEHLMIVSGVAHLQPKGEKAITLRAGGFAMMPSHHMHQFRCSTACTLYVYSDAAFDMHYVDADGKEISPDAALKPFKETAAKAAK